MGAVILVAVAAMLIGSLAWLMPSPRERRQMELRQAAMKLGLRVKIVDLATVIDPERAQPTHCIAYSMVRDVPIEVAGWQIVRERADGHGFANNLLPAGWHWAVGDSLSDAVKHYLHVTLPTLDKDILALESTPYSCMIYWKEHGDVKQVERIAQVLKELVAL